MRHAGKHTRSRDARPIERCNHIHVYALSDPIRDELIGTSNAITTRLPTTTTPFVVCPDLHGDRSLEIMWVRIFVYEDCASNCRPLGSQKVSRAVTAFLLPVSLQCTQFGRVCLLTNLFRCFCSGNSTCLYTSLYVTCAWGFGTNGNIE